MVAAASCRLTIKLTAARIRKNLGCFFKKSGMNQYRNNP